MAGIIGIPGRLQSEWVAGFDRNRRPTSLECALRPERAENPRWERAAQLMLKGAGTDAISQALRLALFHDGSLDLRRTEEP